MEYLRNAIEIARNTADYPPEARFKWNSEVLWAVDSFLAGERHAASGVPAGCARRRDPFGWTLR